MNMVLFLSFFSLLLCLTATGEESVEFLALQDPSSSLQAENGLAVAVQVENQLLKNVSRSVLMAESWVRNHVLAYYPATNISTVIVGQNVLCSKGQEHRFGMILPSIRNIHYSLTRWGLQKDIKVAASFSSNCLDPKSEAYRVDVASSFIKPLLNILQEMASPYAVNPPPHLNLMSAETLILVKSHLKSIKKLGFFHMNKVSIITGSPRTEKPFSFIDTSSKIDPFSPGIGPSGSSSFPAYDARTPLPPLVGKPIDLAPSMPPVSNPAVPPFQPHLAPMVNPAAPSPFSPPHLPPCNPSGGVGAPVGGAHHNGLWCVAKPSVPSEVLQEALDYACGDGGADCEAIGPGGSCHIPDTLVAHASYAFNSYWQKTKRDGGSCGFGGTAMLINSDPSYQRCRFILA